MAVTYAGGSQPVIKFYLEGRELPTQIMLAPPVLLNNTNRPLLLGATLVSDGGGPTYPSFFLEGALDEMSVYSRALSLNEVEGIYNAKKSGKCR